MNMRLYVCVYIYIYSCVLTCSSCRYIPHKTIICPAAPAEDVAIPSCVAVVPHGELPVDCLTCRGQRVPKGAMERAVTHDVKLKNEKLCRESSITELKDIEYKYSMLTLT